MDRTIGDLLETAIGYEIRSQELYRRALELVEDPRARAFLEELVAEEERHQHTLEELREWEIFDPSIPLEDETMAVAGDGAGLPEEIPPGTDLEGIVELALRREHRARTLFQRMAAAARHPELKTLFEKLAEEENSHHESVLERFRLHEGRPRDEM